MGANVNCWTQSIFFGRYRLVSGAIDNLPNKSVIFGNCSFWALSISFGRYRLNWSLYRALSFLFSVKIDANMVKDVVSVRMGRIFTSTHKEAHHSDSEEYEEIGTSSEDEAVDLPPIPFIRRKRRRAPTPPPAPPAPAPPAPEPTPEDPNKVTVDKRVLDWVKETVDKLAKGQEVDPNSLPGPLPGPPSNTPTEEHPFANVRVKKGDRVCPICAHKAHNTYRLRAHIKGHTGTKRDKYKCTKCGRKCSSTRTLKLHTNTCGVDKDHKCTHVFPPEIEGEEGTVCPKSFASPKLLQDHLLTHTAGTKLPCKSSQCKKTFSQPRYLDDHWKHCDHNPEKVGPFPCPVPGCDRGEDRPFRRFRNMSDHLKKVHHYNPKDLPIPPERPTPNDPDNNNNNNNNNNGGNGGGVPPAPDA